MSGDLACHFQLTLPHTWRTNQLEFLVPICLFFIFLVIIELRSGFFFFFAGQSRTHVYLNQFAILSSSCNVRERVCLDIKRKRSPQGQTNGLICITFMHEWSPGWSLAERGMALRPSPVRVGGVCLPVGCTHSLIPLWPSHTADRQLNSLHTHTHTHCGN